MYKIGSEYDEYYRQLEPEVRERLLDALIREGRDDGANAFRKELFGRRHSDPENPSRRVDRWLWYFVNMTVLYRSAKLFPRRARREADAIFRDMGLFEAVSGGEAEQASFYWEARNAFRRYLSTTKSPSYRRKIFGVMQASDSDRDWQTADDAYAVSEGLARRLGMEEQLKLYCDAVSHEYAALDDGAAERFTRGRRS